MPTLEQLKRAFIDADEEGARDEARAYHLAIQQEEKRRSQDPAYSAEGMQMSNPDVPGYVSDDVPWIKPEAPEEGVLSQVGDVVGGIAEVPVTMATGLAGQAVGLGNMIHEGVKAYFAGSQDGRGAAAVDDYFRSEGGRQANEAFSAGAEAATYQPRTEFAQGALETLGEATKSLPPVLGPSLAQAGIAGQAVRGAAPIARARVIDPGVQMAKKGAQKAVDVSKDVVRDVSKRATDAFNKTPDEVQGGSTAGAQKVNSAKLLQAEFDGIGFKGKIPKAVLQQDMAKLSRLHELQRMDEGGPVRESARLNNIAIENQFDDFLDEAGANLYGHSEDVGKFIADELKEQMKVGKKEYDDLYKQAELHGETADPVKLGHFVGFLNNPLVRAADDDPAIARAQKRLINIGAAEYYPARDRNGKDIKLLRPLPVGLNEAEKLRQSVSDANSPYFVRKLKDAFHEDTKGVGGEWYQKSRKARENFSKRFTDDTLMGKITSVDRMTGERKVALEQMVDRIIWSADSNLKSVRHVRNQLRKTENGSQAWREIQGAVLMELKRLSFSRQDFEVGTGARKAAHAPFHKAMARLDRNGKMDEIFGKQGAEQLRIFDKAFRLITVKPDGTFSKSDSDKFVTRYLKGVIEKIPLGDLVTKQAEKVALRKEMAELLKGVDE